MMRPARRNARRKTKQGRRPAWYVFSATAPDRGSVTRSNVAAPDASELSGARGLRTLLRLIEPRSGAAACRGVPRAVTLNKYGVSTPGTTCAWDKSRRDG